MSTFFRHVSGKRDSVLVIKDSGGQVKILTSQLPSRVEITTIELTIALTFDKFQQTFGAFLPDAWKQSKHFYGTGESFVFGLLPRWIQYRWSRKDSMFALTNAKGLMIGGGGSPAIWLDGDFHQGTSGCSQTFNRYAE